MTLSDAQRASQSGYALNKWAPLPTGSISQTKKVRGNFERHGRGGFGRFGPFERKGWRFHIDHVSWPLRDPVLTWPLRDPVLKRGHVAATLKRGHVAATKRDLYEIAILFAQTAQIARIRPSHAARNCP